MKNFGLFIILNLSLLFYLFCGAVDASTSVIRTTGDTTGVSFPEATKNAKPINGNVRGVPFSMWVTGRRQNLNRGFSRRVNKEKVVFRYDFIPEDKTRVLSSKQLLEDKKASQWLRRSGVLVSAYDH